MCQNSSDISPLTKIELTKGKILGSILSDGGIVTVVGNKAPAGGGGGSGLEMDGGNKVVGRIALH